MSISTRLQVRSTDFFSRSSRTRSRLVGSRRSCSVYADKGHNTTGTDSGGGSNARTVDVTAQAGGTSRRSLLQVATVGSLHAWAARSALAADLKAADAAAAAAVGGGGSEVLERQLNERLSEFTLPNGLRFLVYERRAAPIVSFHIYADVGAFDEEDGQTGVAHLLEHMAFKGTPRIGTTDHGREAPLLDALDEVFYSLQEAQSAKERARLQATFEDLQQRAAALSVPNAYGALVSREGGVGLNAATSHDATKYYVSLPANKAELWFALESERFRAPVFRELYSEKAVVLEERRLRVDNAPLGPFTEQFARRSFANNYGRPVIGYAEDIERLGRREVQSFFQRHYGPRSLTIAVAGDVRPAQVRRLADKYFGDWRQGDGAVEPSSCAGEEALEALAVPQGVPPQEWQYSARSRAGPGVMHAYFRPCIRSPDSVPLELASNLLSGTRGSRLYRSLVLSGKALSASAYPALPAEKHPTHFLCIGVPSKQSSIEQLDADLTEQVAALAAKGPLPGELERYKKAARMEVLDALGSNSAIAGALASYQVLTGDWHNVVGDLRRIEGLAPEEVREAAMRHLRPDNCFKGYILPA